MFDEKKEALLEREARNPVQEEKKKKEKERIFLEWSNINYTIQLEEKKEKKNKTQVTDIKIEPSEENEANSKSNSEESSKNSNVRKILHNIEGFAMPNELMAIMGPSGCGKTTLLNVIAQRQLSDDKKHTITRDVRANNLPMDGGNFGKICAYVMQEDILMDCLTPRESLTFGAKLKLKTTDKLIERRVERLIFQFGLEKCANSRVGSVASKGISGGERKRTSIAYEVISNPPIVIIDEPTTGMDSFTSLVIVKYLKQLAMSGKTIICTIHQPSSEVFKYIDRLMLLKDGHLVYQGKAEHSLKYFDAIGCPMPSFCNPFDFFLEILSDANHPYQELNDHYNRLCEEEVRDERVKYHEDYKTRSLPSIEENTRQVNWFVEFGLLLERASVNYIRNRSLFLTRIFNCLFNTLVIMGFYWNIGAEDKKDQLFQNYVGFFFNNVNQFFINGIFCSLFIVPAMKIILKREYSAKLYRLSTFYTSLAITLLINSLIYTLIFTPICFFSINLLVSDPIQNFWQFWIFFFINFFMFTLGQFFGLCIGGSFAENVSLVISPFILLIFMLGSGFYRSNDSLPKFISWLFYTSPYKYLLELLMKNFEHFNAITEHIPEQMKYDYGLEICISVLLATSAIILILGFIGIKLYASKF